MDKIGILGAGLAGLSAARSLGGACEVIEKEDEAGGLCRSRHVNGFVFDYGPHVFYTKSSWVKRLVSSALRLNGNNRLIGKPRRAYIYMNGVYVKYPFEANLYPLSGKVKEECIAGAKERGGGAKKTGNFMDWILSSFGRGIAKYYMVPYNEKVWKYPLDRMGTEWIAGRVPAPQLQDIMRGARGSEGREFGGNKYFYYPLSGGIGAIPAALGSGGLRCGCDVEEIKKCGPCGLKVIFTDRKLGRKKAKTFRRLVSTLPLPEVVRRLNDAPSEVELASQLLVHNSSVCIGLGLGRPDISEKHWLYFPEKKYAFNRISFPGNFSENAVPKGKSSVLAEVTYISKDGQPPKSREHYVGEVVGGLRDAEILRNREEPEVADVSVLKYAYVVYDLAHSRNVRLVRSFLREMGIFTAGRFGEWEYLNMDASILSGREAARELKK